MIVFDEVVKESWVHVRGVDSFMREIRHRGFSFASSSRGAEVGMISYASAIRCVREALDHVLIDEIIDVGEEDGERPIGYLRGVTSVP